MTDNPAPSDNTPKECAGCADRKEREMAGESAEQ